MLVNKIVGTTLSVDGTDDCHDKVLEAIEAGVTSWHIDVCRTNFAPCEAGSSKFIEEFCRFPHKELDVHLMTQYPADSFESLADLGISLCTPHIEVANSTNILSLMLARRFSPGFAIKIDTPLARIMPLLASLDRVLLICGQLGVAGQSFNHQVLERIQELAEFRQKFVLGFRIGVDGGIHPETAKLCAAAGANDFCCGSWILHGSHGAEPKVAGPIAHRVAQMLEAIQ